MQIVVGGLLTNYEQTGKGKTILLLHGWGDSLRTFDQLTADLSPNFQVLRLDLPGFGSSQAPNETWDLSSYANFVRNALEKLNIKEVFAIIGHSNGGALAVHGLATGTLKSKRLVLLAASGIRDRQKARRLLLKITAKTGKAATFWLSEHKKQSLRKKLYGVSGSDLMVAPHLQDTFKKTVRQDVQADAAKLSQSTLLLYGQNDRATPTFFGEIFNGLIVDSKLEVLPDAEHFLHQDQPEQVAKSIKEFLS